MQYLQKENYLFSADVIGIAESRWLPLENEAMFSIDGFNAFRNDAAGNSLNRPYYGTVVFTRCSVSILDKLKLNIQGIELTIQEIEKMALM